MKKKLISSISLVALLFYFYKCEKSNKYVHQYPFFTKEYEYKETKAISLNNFESMQNKNGTEYLLSTSGKLFEIRNWKNNLLNGNLISISTNGNVKTLGNYINDTLCNYYYLLDSISKKILNYREKIKSNVGVSDNQFIHFENGKINDSHSYYYKIKCLKDNNYRISILGKKDFPFLKIFVTEINENKFVYDDNIDGALIELKNSIFLDYKIKNMSSKYLSGKIFNYRYLTDQEIADQNLNKGETMASIMYFKFKIK